MNHELNRLTRSLCFRLWIWAVHLNTLLFAMLLFREGGGLFVPYIFPVWITSFLLSLPAFGALYILMPMLVYNNLPYRSILYIMLAGCILLGAGVFFVFLLMAGGWLEHQAMLLAGLPAAAAAAAMLLQYKKLLLICNERDFINKEIRHFGESLIN